MEDLKGLEIKKPKNAPVEVKIPNDILKVMNELKEKKHKLLQEYLNVSFQADTIDREVKIKVETINKQKKEVYDGITQNNEMYGQKIKYAINKLKLKKRKNYRWGFNGKDTFIGQLVPEQPKKK